MTGMIEVKVKLPVPPDGYEYTGECRAPKQGEPHLTVNGTVAMGASGSGTTRIILRPIKPATVSVTLRREDAETLTSVLNPNVEVWYGRVKAACKAALGEQKCGGLICEIKGTEHGLTGAHYTCALPANHDGEHAPESLP